MSLMGGVFPCIVTWGCDKGKRLAGWELTRQNVLAAHTGLSRRAGGTQGVSHTRHKARGCDLPPCLTCPAHKSRRGMCAPLCLTYRRSPDPQRIGKHKPGVMRNRVALLPTCFAFHCLLERGRRAGQPPYPLNVPGAGDTPPHPQAVFLFWCARTASVPPSLVAHKKSLPPGAPRYITAEVVLPVPTL